VNKPVSFDCYSLQLNVFYRYLSSCTVGVLMLCKMFILGIVVLWRPIDCISNKIITCINIIYGTYKSKSLMLRPASAHLSFQGPELHFSECACVCCSMGFMSEVKIYTQTQPTILCTKLAFVNVLCYSATVLTRYMQA